MVNDDMEAAKPKETLESPNPDGKIDGDAPNLGGPGDSQIGERGPRVSAQEEEGDGGGGVDDDMSVTLAQLSSKRAGKKIKAAAAKEGGDAGLADEKTEDTSGGDCDSVTLRRSRRNRNDVDPGDETKKLKVDEDGETMEEDRKPEEEDEDEEDEESEFSVGDFVWGKVKSHPWWPGRVFDPSDASQQALKYKHEGRILVAYFGDATFAWCNPSQLKPFVENFAEMSNQSVSKSFVNAVEEAVSEFGRLVELDMMCYCSPRHELSDHHQTSALNAGIKGGVNVNKGGIGIYSVDRFNPAAFLADLRIVGNHASVPNLLELTTLKSWVSAVYRSKDGPLLLKFNELHEAAEDEGDGVGIEDSARGPVEEPVQVLPGMPDALGPAKRKERSVAEILYGDEKGNNEDGAVVEGEKGVKTDSKSGRKKRKVADGNQMKTADQEESLGDESLVTQSGKRKKKSEEAPKGETDHGDNPEEEKKEGRRSSRMKVAKGSLKPLVVIESDLAALEESEMSPRTRDRKKSKYLSPPYTNLEYYRQTAMTSPRVAAETKAVESSLVSQSGETRSKPTPASAQDSGSTPLMKCSGETSKKKLPKEDGKPNGSAPATPKRASSRKVGGNPTISVTSSNNVLSGIQSAARSGRLSKGDRSLNAVKGFLASYRSSKYQNVSGCNPSEADNQSEGKGESTLGSDHEVANKEKKSVKKSKTKNEKPKLKSKAKVVDSEKDGKMTGTPKSATLHLKFPPDHPLPSKDDLGAMFGKFGALETSKTRVSQKSYSAKLVFVRSSDAEEACKSSKANSPFGAAEVTYRILNLRGTSEEEADENGFSKKDSTNPASQKRKRSSKKQSLASVSNGGLRLVKQKLEGMATMVAEAGDGKMSSKIKSDLENRLKDLLDEVKALPASPLASGTGV